MRPAQGPAFYICGWRRLARPASKAELDFTRGTVTLVVAPEEHPFPIGLRSKREARCVGEPTRRHATPLTEALHVPLHLDRWCWDTISRPMQMTAGAGQAPWPRAGRLGVPGCSGHGRLRTAVPDGNARGACSVQIRELRAAVPSTSASPSVIRQSLFCAFSPHKARSTRDPTMTRTRTGGLALVVCRQPSRSPARALASKLG